MVLVILPINDLDLGVELYQGVISLQEKKDKREYSSGRLIHFFMKVKFAWFHGLGIQ